MHVRAVFIVALLTATSRAISSNENTFSPVESFTALYNNNEPVKPIKKDETNHFNSSLGAAKVYALAFSFGYVSGILPDLAPLALFPLIALSKNDGLWLSIVGKVCIGYYSGLALGIATRRNGWTKGL